MKNAYLVKEINIEDDSEKVIAITTLLEDATTIMRGYVAESKNIPQKVRFEVTEYHSDTK